LEIRCGFDCGDRRSFFVALTVDMPDWEGPAKPPLGGGGGAESCAMRWAVSGAITPDGLRCARLVSRAMRLAAVSRAKLGTLSTREWWYGVRGDGVTVRSGSMF
jgi:hypothetical protein